MDAMFNGTVLDMPPHSSFRAHTVNLTQGAICPCGRRCTGGSLEPIYGMGWTYDYNTIARTNADVRVQGGTIWAVLRSVRKPHCLGRYRRKDRETGSAMVGEKMAEN